VIPEVPVLVGLVPGGGAPDAGEALDVRVIDFMNHPLGGGGRAVDGAGVAVPVAGVLSVAGRSGEVVGFGYDAGFRGV
jgi:hypothetical protein